jgi:hypothetical protein
LWLANVVKCDFTQVPSMRNGAALSCDPCGGKILK